MTKDLSTSEKKRLAKQIMGERNTSSSIPGFATIDALGPDKMEDPSSLEYMKRKNEDRLYDSQSRKDANKARKSKQKNLNLKQQIRNKKLLQETK